MARRSGRILSNPSSLQPLPYLFLLPVFLDVRFFAVFFFSVRTPLNFFADFFFLPGRFSAMNSPEFLSRFAQALAPPIVALVCERFFTAPLRALSPVGLLTAI